MFQSCKSSQIVSHRLFYCHFGHFAYISKLKLSFDSRRFLLCNYAVSIDDWAFEALFTDPCDYRQTPSRRPAVVLPLNPRRQATFDVAIYRPIDRRDPHHWAIHIVSPVRRRGTIQQVEDEVGGRGYFVSPVRWRIAPNRASRHRVSVIVGYVRRRDVGLVRWIIQNWPVNNRSSRWNCQRWVIELVWALFRAGLLRCRWRGIRRIMRMREYWQ